DTKFEALYNEEVQYLGNQVRGGRDSHTNYQRKCGNQGWNKDRKSGWKDWRGGNMRDREMEENSYVPPHDRPLLTEQALLEGSLTANMFSRIYNKVEGSDKVLKKLKNDFST
ncbi:hypothetical protein MTR67_002504, partial [Solanum verrucosum]